MAGITSKGRARISTAVKAALTGVPKTAAHREAIRQAALLRGQDPGYRAKLSVAWYRNPQTPDPIGPMKGECVYCGEPGGDREHPYPDDRTFTLISCRRCNQSKQRRTPDEWLAAGLYAS